MTQAIRMTGDGSFQGPSTGYAWGEITFTNGEMVHAFRHFNDWYDKASPAERANGDECSAVMGGCMAHACGWDDDYINAQEAKHKAGNTEFVELMDKLYGMYLAAKSGGFYGSASAAQS